MDVNIQQRTTITHPLVPEASVSAEAAVRYHQPKVLFFSFFLSTLILLALTSIVRWPKVSPPAQLPLRVHLAPSPVLTQTPQNQSSSQAPSQQAPPLNNPQKQSAPAEASPLASLPAEIKLPQPEVATNKVPLSAKLFDTLKYQEPNHEPYQGQHLNRGNRLESSKSTGSSGDASNQIQTYQAQNGDTMVAIDGRCYRVFDDKFSPTGKSWSLPTRCTGYKTESDRFAEGLRKAMQERFSDR